MATWLALLTALGLDWKLGEPQRWHPLVLFGNLATRVEQRLRRGSAGAGFERRAGIMAWLLLVLLPTLVVSLLLSILPAAADWLLGVVLLYLAIGWQSLLQHAKAVFEPLVAGHLAEARVRVGYIVSRDTAELDEAQVASAATESVLENGADAIFAAIFWFCILGPAGVVLYRCANTLDAMWGYRTERYRHFGWAAARLDDVLNWIPARLTAFSYAIVGNFRVAIDCWRRQAGECESPNAGPVMAAGAGALHVRLGGAAPYHGEWRWRPELGAGDEVAPGHIVAAVALVNRALFLWVLLLPLLWRWL